MPSFFDCLVFRPSPVDRVLRCGCQFLSPARRELLTVACDRRSSRNRGGHALIEGASFRSQMPPGEATARRPCLLPHGISLCSRPGRTAAARITLSISPPRRAMCLLALRGVHGSADGQFRTHTSLEGLRARGLNLAFPTYLARLPSARSGRKPTPQS